MTLVEASQRRRMDPIPLALFLCGVAVVCSTAVPGMAMLRLGLLVPILVVGGLVFWGWRAPRGMFGPFEFMVSMIGLALFASSLWAEVPSEAFRAAGSLILTILTFIAFRYLLAAMGLRRGASVLGLVGAIFVIVYAVSIGASRLLESPIPAGWWMLDRGSIRFNGLAAGPGVLSICTTILLAAAMIGWRGRPLALLATTTGAVVVIFASGSRTGLLGVLLLGIFFVATSIGRTLDDAMRRRILSTSFLLTVVGLGFVLAGYLGGLGEGIAERFASVVHDSSRLRLWGFGLEILGEHPATGLGLGEVQQSFVAGDVVPGLGVELGAKDLWLHNTYLEIGSAAGLLALLPAGWLVVLTARAFREASDPTAGYLLVVGVFSQFAFHSLQSTSLFGLALALLAQFVMEAREDVGATSPGAVRFPSRSRHEAVREVVN